LQVENQVDDAVPASHNPTIHTALATPDKEYVRIVGARPWENASGVSVDALCFPGARAETPTDGLARAG
jgi:hypothetical protein